MHFAQGIARVAQLHQQAGSEIAQRAKSADAQLATSADPISEQAGGESAVEEVGATTVFHGDNDGENRGEIHRSSHSDSIGEQRAGSNPSSASLGASEAAVDVGREAEGEMGHPTVDSGNPTVQMDRLAMDIGHPSQRSLDERLKEGDVEALEIPMESRRAFEEAWQGVIAAGGEEKLSPPKEIVWLNGAPGAGKGANTPFILRTRGFEARAIQVSDLLGGNEDVAAIMRSGGLVSDSMVLQIVLQRILTLGNTPAMLQDADHSEVVANPHLPPFFLSPQHPHPRSLVLLPPPSHQRILTLGYTPAMLQDADHAMLQDADHAMLQDADHGEVVANPEAGGKVAGAVVDGFPRTTVQVDFIKMLYDSFQRTTVQVDFIKMLYDRLMELHHKYLNTPLEAQFPRPIFRIAVLYVEEEESVRRQLARGRAAIQHNQRVVDSGIGELQEVRATDLCEKSARRRYHIFRQHYDTLLRLKAFFPFHLIDGMGTLAECREQAFFPFHLIDGMGTLAECREQIEKELQYQSALELNLTTFRAISHIPLASDIAKYARQNMVTRLDSYQQKDPATFKEVIAVIDSQVIPIIRRSALSGFAIFNTELPVFFDRPGAPQMLADILAERGYFVYWQTRIREVPVRIDPSTFAIECLRRTTMELPLPPCFLPLPLPPPSSLHIRRAFVKSHPSLPPLPSPPFSPQTRIREVPVRIDPSTFAIECLRRTTMEFRIKFDRPLIRSSDSLSSLSASSSFLTATAAKASASASSPSYSSSHSLLTLQSATFQPPPETKASAMCPSFPGGNPPCFVPDKELNGGSSEEDGSGASDVTGVYECE
ncbi:unnamed protein product [Closterium sp. NIES-64]|nr:unnamed protein product [Closterium sp. NIES-64]